MTAVLAQPVLFLIVDQGCYTFSRDRVLISSTLPHSQPIILPLQ
jgi:hypothetical protein